MRPVLMPARSGDAGKVKTPKRSKSGLDQAAIPAVPAVSAMAASMMALPMPGDTLETKEAWAPDTQPETNTDALRNDALLEIENSGQDATDDAPTRQLSQTFLDSDANGLGLAPEGLVFEHGQTDVMASEQDMYLNINPEPDVEPEPTQQQQQQEEAELLYNPAEQSIYEAEPEPHIKQQDSSNTHNYENTKDWTNTAAVPLMNGVGPEPVGPAEQDEPLLYEDVSVPAPKRYSAPPVTEPPLDAIDPSFEQSIYEDVPDVPKASRRPAPVQEPEPAPQAELIEPEAQANYAASNVHAATAVPFDPSKDELVAPELWSSIECIMWLKHHKFKDFVDVFYNNGFEGSQLVLLSVDSFRSLRNISPERCQELIDAIDVLKGNGGWLPPDIDVAPIFTRPLTSPRPNATPPEPRLCDVCRNKTAILICLQGCQSRPFCKDCFQYVHMSLSPEQRKEHVIQHLDADSMPVFLHLLLLIATNRPRLFYNGASACRVYADTGHYQREGGGNFDSGPSGRGRVFDPAKRQAARRCRAVAHSRWSRAPLPSRAPRIRWPLRHQHWPSVRQSRGTPDINNAFASS